MTRATEQGRLVFFADLRPHHVIHTQDDTGAERTLVALAILEYPSLEWDVTEDQIAAALSSEANPGAGEASASQAAYLLGLGRGTPIVAHCILELDQDGDVIDDWYPGELDACKAFLDRYDGAVWESLPADREQATSEIEDRLAQLPGGA